MKKILDVFASYCDAYLSYSNGCETFGAFCDANEIDENEMQNVLDIVFGDLYKSKLPLCAIDMYMNQANNKNKYKYTEL